MCKLKLEKESQAETHVVKLGIPVTKKKLAELELSLLHLQQNIEIPELSLTLNPIVQKAIDQVGSHAPHRLIEIN